MIEMSCNKHEWTDETLDEKGHRTCIYCGKSEYMNVLDSIILEGDEVYDEECECESEQPDDGVDLEKQYHDDLLHDAGDSD